MANNLGSAGKLNINGNINGADNGYNETFKMNKTSTGFGPLRKTYEEKLDNFMASHNLKYIENPKIEKSPTPPINQAEHETAQPNSSNKGKKIITTKK